MQVIDMYHRHLLPILLLFYGSSLAHICTFHNEILIAIFLQIVPCTQYGKDWWRLIASDLDLDTLNQIAIEYQTKSKLFQADIEESKKRPARETAQKRISMPEGLL